MIAILNGLFLNVEVGWLFWFFVGCLTVEFVWRLIHR